MILLKNLILQFKKNYGPIIFVKSILTHYEFLSNNQAQRSQNKK